MAFTSLVVARIAPPGMIGNERETTVLESECVRRDELTEQSKIRSETSPEEQGFELICLCCDLISGAATAYRETEQIPRDMVSRLALPHNSGVRGLDREREARGAKGLEDKRVSSGCSEASHYSKLSLSPVGCCRCAAS